VHALSFASSCLWHMRPEKADRCARPGDRHEPAHFCQ